jgi:hypothetical protein
MDCLRGPLERIVGFGQLTKPVLLLRLLTAEVGAWRSTDRIPRTYVALNAYDGGMLMRSARRRERRVELFQSGLRKRIPWSKVNVCAGAWRALAERATSRREHALGRIQRRVKRLRHDRASENMLECPRSPLERIVSCRPPDRLTLERHAPVCVQNLARQSAESVP